MHRHGAIRQPPTVDGGTGDAGRFALAWLRPGFWLIPTGLFVVGWVLQFLGHWVEGKPPEFFKDWRFLFVGLRWWIAKMRGHA